MQRLRNRDFLAGLVLLVIGLVSLAEARFGVRDWLFPLLATYVILAFAGILLLTVAYAAVTERAPEIIEWSAEDRAVWIDLLVFCAIILVYLLVMSGLGFWLSSLLMLVATSIYLTLNKTRRSIGLAIAVPVATCVVSYIVFMHLFYVPVPRASWWPGFG